MWMIYLQSPILPIHCCLLTIQKYFPAMHACIRYFTSTIRYWLFLEMELSTWAIFKNSQMCSLNLSFNNKLLTLYQIDSNLISHCSKHRDLTSHEIIIKIKFAQRHIICGTVRTFSRFGIISWSLHLALPQLTYCSQLWSPYLIETGSCRKSTEVCHQIIWIITHQITEYNCFNCQCIYTLNYYMHAWTTLYHSQIKHL